MRLSTLPPSGLHRCQHSPSLIPLRRECPRLCHKTNRLRYQKTQSQKNPQRDLSQSIYKDVTRSYFECKPLAYCRQKPEQREKGGVEENTEKEELDRWMSVLVSTTLSPISVPLHRGLVSPRCSTENWTTGTLLTTSADQSAARTRLNLACIWITLWIQLSLCLPSYNY